MMNRLNIFSKKTLAAAVMMSCIQISSNAAPLPDSTLLNIGQGSGSAVNIPCPNGGSCFGMEVSPGTVVWTDFAPGTDGGLVVGKNQASGSQEIGSSMSNSTPGEVTAAWAFRANYGTLYTPAGSTNVYDNASCTGAGCIGITELNSWDVAWNGIDIPMGSANGCLSEFCTADQLAGIFVSDWTVNPDNTYSMNYSQVVPDGSPTGFGGVKFFLHLGGNIKTPPSAPLPDGTLLTVGQGSGSAINIPCPNGGSCFGMEVSPGTVVWTDVAPGTDGGLIVGKNQASGGQEIGSSFSNSAPGEVTAAWQFKTIFGTFFTPAGSTNQYHGTSCSGAGCAGVTELNSWNVAWNGVSVPLGSANGCLSAFCTADQLAGIFVSNWAVNPDNTYSMDYSQVVPDGDPSGFGNVKFSLRLGGAIASPTLGLSGFWPSQGQPGTPIFVFGENFTQGTEVSVNGVPAPLRQVLDPSVLIFLLPEGNTVGPITVTTTLGSTISSTSFGTPLPGLGISGLWPDSGSAGTIVFVFGSGFELGGTAVAFNGITVPFGAVLSDSLLLTMVPPGSTTGPISITTSTEAFTTVGDFIITP